jgi:hypothetical protein
MPRGGKLGNKGGGRPKGYKEKRTLEREAVERAFQQQIMEQTKPLVAAQLENAVGTKYLVKREKSGKFVRLTPETLEQALAGEEDVIIEVYDKDPNVQAFTQLMDRAFGRPTENLKGTFDVNVTLNLEERIKAARKRG